MGGKSSHLKKKEKAVNVSWERTTIIRKGTGHRRRKACSSYSGESLSTKGIKRDTKTLRGGEGKGDECHRGNGGSLSVHIYLPSFEELTWAEGEQNYQ